MRADGGETQFVGRRLAQGIDSCFQEYAEVPGAPSPPSAPCFRKIIVPRICQGYPPLIQTSQSRGKRPAAIIRPLGEGGIRNGMWPDREIGTRLSTRRIDLNASKPWRDAVSKTCKDVIDSQRSRIESYPCRRQPKRTIQGNWLLLGKFSNSQRSTARLLKF